jgi:hypothetical protein
MAYSLRNGVPFIPLSLCISAKYFDIFKITGWKICSVRKTAKFSQSCSAVIVDTRKAGFDFSAIVHVSLARHEQRNVERFVKEVSRHPEVLECYATSGEADFHLRVVVEDIDAYNAFLDDFIFRLPGVSQVRSNVVLKEIKADTALPFRTT